MTTSRYLPLLATSAGLALAIGCATQSASNVRLSSTGDSLATAEAAMKTAPPKDAVLWQYRLGAMCLRAGRHDEAKAHLDEALTRINGIMGPDKNAAAARNTFKAEAKKTFIGEP